jgi:hypothetical protein
MQGVAINSIFWRRFPSSHLPSDARLYICIT